MNKLGTTFCFGIAYADFKFIYVYTLWIYEKCNQLYLKTVVEQYIKINMCGS